MNKKTTLARQQQIKKIPLSHDQTPVNSTFFSWTHGFIQRNLLTSLFVKYHCEEKTMS